MSIICIGRCTYDLTSPIQEPLIENQKCRITEPFSCIGTPAANAAYLCALWNTETALISRYGKDFYGAEIRGVLKGAGVNTAYLMKGESSSIPVSAIIANSFSGYRIIFNCPGIRRKLEFHYLEQAEILLLDGYELQASLEALSRYPDIDSIMDTGTFHGKTSVLAQKVTYLVCSQDYARRFSNAEVFIQDENSWRQAFDTLHVLNTGHIVVVLGDQGLLYRDTQEVHHIGTFNVSTVDTTGAGNIFHGAFTYCVHESHPLQDALIIASAISAISVQTLGGQTSIPAKAAVNRFLNEQCCHLILKQPYTLYTDCFQVTCCFNFFNEYGWNMMNYNYYPICRNACDCAYELSFYKVVSEV